MGVDQILTGASPSTNPVTSKGQGGRHVRVLSAEAVPEDGNASAEHLPARHPDLRRLLVGCDVAAVTAGWGAALVVAPVVTGALSSVGEVAQRQAAAAVLAAITLALISGQQLWLARICTMRTVEHLRLMRAVVGAGVAGWVAAALLPFTLSVGTLLAGAVLTLMSLVVFRSGYRAWLEQGRSAGRFNRSIVVVALDVDRATLCELLVQNPELGYRVVGFVDPVDGGPDHRALSVRIAELVRASGASGAIMAANALPSQELNEAVRGLVDAGVHVHLWTGLQGITQSRLRFQPLAREPFFYVEQQTQAAWQTAAKRLVDMLGAALGLCVTAPILVASAVAIKAHDGGPVIFRQRRVGRGGEPFTCYKLRTMVPDAERRLPLLRDRNERSGPLFKIADDPRTTPVGRILRAAHIDELPQLINVLHGTMSLVGPRPCLPAEERHFGDQLRARRQVRPGITGLWQVESNDKPYFDAYQRLDIFYVENWTVGLDLAILLATIERLTVRVLMGSWVSLRAAARYASSAMRGGHRAEQASAP